MEHYKKVLEKRLRAFIVLICFIPMLLLAVPQRLFGEMGGFTNEALSEFIAGARFGILVAMEVYLMVMILRFSRALKSEEGTKKLYFYEMDERRTMIREKIGGYGYDIAMSGLLLGALMAARVNEVVFFSLLGATLFMVSVKGCMKIYVRRKY